MHDLERLSRGALGAQASGRPRQRSFRRQRGPRSQSGLFCFWSLFSSLFSSVGLAGAWRRLLLGTRPAWSALRRARRRMAGGRCEDIRAGGSLQGKMIRPPCTDCAGRLLHRRWTGSRGRRGRCASCRERGWARRSPCPLCRRTCPSKIGRPSVHSDLLGGNRASSQTPAQERSARTASRTGCVSFGASVCLRPVGQPFHMRPMCSFDMGRVSWESTASHAHLKLGRLFCIAVGPRSGGRRPFEGASSQMAHMDSGSHL